MGDILGLGCTHYPGLTVPDEQLPGLFHRLLTAPNVPERYKNPANWPAELIAELGNDEGFSSAQRYSARLADGFRAVRKSLDEFNPDVVVVWGDDQYENFREDIIPAFCLFGLTTISPVTAVEERQWRQQQSLGRAWRLALEAARPPRRGQVPRDRIDRARHRHGLCL